MKSYINRFNKMSNFVAWSQDARILAHLTNDVLPEILFWDELQQKECWSLDEFYRKARKYLNLEDSKEALRKTEVTTDKKNDPDARVEGQQGQDKKRRQDKRARNPKKQKSVLVEKKRPLLKYNNYHSLTALLDHVYAITDKNLYRPPEPMKRDKFRRDIKEN